MKSKTIRRKYFIHPSSQLKYIAMSIFPLLIGGVFCVFFLILNGNIILRVQKGQCFSVASVIKATINRLEKESYPQSAISKINVLKNELLGLDNTFRESYYDVLRCWFETQMFVVAVVSVTILLAAFFSLILSHRVAGPIYRLRHSLDMLSQGIDIPSVQVRHTDEFKELAESVEKLRVVLKEKGLLGWGSKNI